MTEISSKKTTLTSFLVNIIDIATNVTIAMLTGSVVMISESLQGVADLIASGLLLLGLSKSSIRASDTLNHPLGRGRELYFWTLIASILMLFLTSSLSFYLGLTRYLHPEPVQNIYLALIVLGIAIITNGYALSLDIRRILQGQSITLLIHQLKNSLFIETKTTFVLDLMGTCAAILGIISLTLYQLTGHTQFDGIGAMTVGVVLAILSIILIKDVKQLLMGKSANKSIENQIKNIALTNPEVRRVAQIKTVLSGNNRIIASLDLHLINKLDTDAIEKLTEKIKHQVREELPSIEDLQIELVS